MNKLISTLFFCIFFITFAEAKKNDAIMFLGVGATIAGDASSMTGSDPYRERTYETKISDGTEQISVHVGFFVDYISDIIEITYSTFLLRDSSDDKEGKLSITELNFVNQIEEWRVGFISKKIDIIVPYYVIGFGSASWSDKNKDTKENFTESVGKFGLGTYFHIGPDTWLDISYNIRELGFLNKSSKEQAPLHTAHVALKVYF